MKNILKTTVIIFGIILASVSMAVITGNSQLPDAGVKINYSPQRIKSGKYAADSVSVCTQRTTKTDFINSSGIEIAWPERHMLQPIKWTPELNTQASSIKSHRRFS